MADSNVPITPGTGTNIDTRTSPDGDHRQVVVQGDPDTAATQKVNTSGDAVVSMGHPSSLPLGIYAGVTAYGNMRVTTEPSGLFYDTFDSSSVLDTTTKWSTVGTAPTATTGMAQLNAGATASASSALISRPVFGNLGVNFLAAGWTGRFENNSAASGGLFATGTHTFMGFGLPPTTWSATYTASTTTGPLLNGVGFEIDTDGNMYPAIYDNGTRTRPTLVTGQASLNVGRTLANGSMHQFLVVIRADAVFFYLNGTNSPIAVYNYASTGFSIPDTSTLPLRFAQINTATVTGAAPVRRFGAIGVGDTGANNQMLSDGVNPWRKAGVTVPAEQLPGAATTGSQGPALNVNPNAIQKATFIANTTASYTTVANTAKPLLSLHHAASSTRTVRIRRITVGFMSATATAANVLASIQRGVAAPTAGAVVAAAPAVPGSTAADTIINQSTTLAIAVTTSLHTEHFGPIAASGSLSSKVLYDWQESGETIPLTLRAGFLDSIVVLVTSTIAHTLNCYVTVIFTEE